MKKHLLFIVIYTSISGITFSQNILEQLFPVYSEKYRDPIELINEMTRGSLTDISTNLFRPIRAITDDEKFFYTYDDNGRITSWYSEVWANDSWVKKSRFTYTYDVNGNITSWLREDWSNSVWTPFWKYNYSYDINGNMIYNQWQHWQNGTWKYDYRFLFTYNSSNKTIEWLHQVWSDDWVNYYKYNYIYSNGNISTAYQAVWANGDWVNLGRSSYFYDINNNMLLWMGEYWVNNAWRNYQKISYTFDNRGNMLSKITENWENGNWKRQNQLVNIYNITNILVRQISQQWTINAWANLSQTTYTHDSNNNLLLEFTEIWESNAWESNWNYTYDYDINGNAIHAASFRWNNGWEPSDGYMQTSYNAGADYLKFTCKYVDVQYNIFTGTDDYKQELIYSLENNYPNPFNPATTIKYSLPEAGSVRLLVYNSLGQLVSELKNQSEYAGFYEVNFNAADLSSGIYFYSIIIQSLDGNESYSSTKKMVLLK